MAGCFRRGFWSGRWCWTDKRLRVVLAADYQRLEFLRVLRSHELEPITDPGEPLAPPC
jgi:rod shape-determining protein MreC